jgi:hypothetical protein
LALGLSLLASPAAGQITEPNGTVVPGPSDRPQEITLESFFTDAGETIDPVATASIEPGTFSPRCDFEATLVLSESGAEGGLAWYNVPDDPNVAPTAIYDLLLPTSQTGMVINSADIITSPDYAGGLIGFALTKDFGSGPQAIYYSEYQRNTLCSECVMPDHWKMMLVYGSTSIPNTFYLAFEDWEGANNQEWFGNDGDFNDKVFRVTGVTCLGGGEPCDTGKLGHCAAGLTECQPGGTLACRQQVLESDEVCDNVDNNCDGEVDNGAPCPQGEICRQGVCQPPCGGGEFRCRGDLYCTAEGLCIDPDCRDVTCEVGQVCRAGNCVAPCDGVTCPLGQVCQIGRCVDPCAGVTCEGTTVCDRGVCIEPCNCRPCSNGLVCAASGACVESGCETAVCEAGTLCSGGSCLDACEGAVCPGNAQCLAGQCGEPEDTASAVTTTTSTTGSVIGATDGIVVPPSMGAVGSASSGGAGGTGDGDGASGSARAAGEDGGCGCRLTNSTPNLCAGTGGLLCLGLVRLRRRQRARIRRT